ncbi:MAG TPA: hypothetical protein VGC30_01670 [Dokdonella sp.]
MTDERWRRRLEPPPGGLERLAAAIAARRGAQPRSRAPFALAGATAAAAAALALAGYLREAPQRAFERDLRAALAAGLRDETRERGVVRELPSGRADVRILVVAPPPSPPPR